jgi:hypothetical protein
MTRTIFRAALALAIISVLVPLVVVFILVLVAIFLGIALQYVYLITLATVPLLSLLVYFGFRPKLTGLTLGKKKDWERLAGILTLTFTVIGAMVAIEAFFGQTVTQSSCINPSNVNVTSPNCKTIQTVSVSQSTQLGPWVTLALIVLLLIIIVFGVWTGILYTFRKAEML